MIDFSITDEQELMLENLREFCARECTEERIQKWYEQRHIDSDVCKAYLEAGFGYMFIPEEYGGVSSDAVTLALVVTELMRSTKATMPFMSYGLAMFDLSEFGTPELIEEGMKLYEETGEQCFSLALSEPCAGSDNMAMQTVAHWNGDGTVTLNGVKTMVSLAETAPFMLVIAKDEDPARENKDMSMWMFRADTPGIKLSPLHKIGQEITNFSEVYLDNVTVPESCMLGERGKGFLQLMKNFELERIMLASHSLGLAKAALEESAAYASERIAFGKTIGSFQLIQEKLTDMEIKVQNMEHLLLKTAWEFDNDISIRLDSALAKRYISMSATEVCSEAMQIMGGIGYTTESCVGRLWKDARGSQFGGGTDEIMVHIAGRQIAKKYARS